MKPTTRRGNPATVAAWTSFDWLNWGQMNEGERRLREAIAEVGRAGSRSSRSSRSALRCLFEAAADRPYNTESCWRMIEFLARMPTDTKIFLTMAVLGLATVLGLAYSPSRPF
jgi:hypothetical protein